MKGKTDMLRKSLPLEQKKKLFILGAMVLVGFGLRIATCYWGYPYQLHPDEPVIVNHAIDMISRHSWEANIYNRPDHFEIKCCAILFQIVSFLKFHVSADVAYFGNEMVFYLVARGFTAIFGTLMIPLSYLLLEKIKKGSGLLGAGIVTFFNIFVEHSAYATPDIVLTFFIMLVAYISLLYLEKPDKWKVFAMSFVTGLGITVKYTCAISCLYIAFVVIFDCIKRKDYKKIFHWGILAICTVLLTCFFMAPNLFTNISETIRILAFESGSSHSGADGQSSFANFCYYLETFTGNIGNEILVFELIGLAYILKSKNHNCISFVLGALFWVCTSVLKLHWERWGMPMYIFYILLAALGISYAFDVVQNIADCAKHKKHSFLSVKYAKPLLICLVCILGTSIILSGVTKTMYQLSTDTRLLALEYCEENGINAENSLSESYTPFNMNKAIGMIPVELDENGLIALREDQKKASYIILSSGMYDRYYAESERYSKEVQVYDAIQSQCELIKSFSPTVNDGADWILPNIINRLKFICDYGEDTTSGYNILIYRLKR